MFVYAIMFRQILQCRSFHLVLCLPWTLWFFFTLTFIVRMLSMEHGVTCLTLFFFILNWYLNIFDLRQGAPSMVLCSRSLGISTLVTMSVLRLRLWSACHYSIYYFHQEQSHHLTVFGKSRSHMWWTPDDARRPSLTNKKVLNETNSWRRIIITGHQESSPPPLFTLLLTSLTCNPAVESWQERS